ncbi:MAG TPA: enoyl-CoA hydratase/isomerase family protein [Devosia sp.]|nr:enoyl-CoA hydratase/isomerase family protein [Devosia sp.]
MSADSKNETLTPSGEDSIIYEVADNIATITLNRPEKLNAFDDPMVFKLIAALRRFDTDPDAFVAVIKGNGRAFSSGADVRQRQMRSKQEFENLGGSAAGWGANAHELLLKSANWKPVITAPHGYAIGMGLGMCLDSEMIVAEEGTQFQVTETRRGLGAARYYSLLKFRGGASIAIDVALTGRFFTAEEAHAAGVIDRVAPKGKAYEVALELARQINKNPPLSARQTTRVRRWYLEKLEHEIMFYVRALKLTLTEDFSESARAFTEKRPPKPWKGR